MPRPAAAKRPGGENDLSDGPAGLQEPAVTGSTESRSVVPFVTANTAPVPSKTAVQQ